MYKTCVAELMRSLHHSQKVSSKARQSQSIWKCCEHALQVSLT